MNQSEFRSILKTEAENLGFILSGVVSSHFSPNIARYQKWLSNGYHGNMKYLESERSILIRSEPRRLFPDAKSILIFALPYPNPSIYPFPVEPSLIARISSYAWGIDYHILAPRLLKKLVDRLIISTGKTIQFATFTDSAPILERELAFQAGLGWIGKNSCLITPQIGSYYFLAELMIDIELDPDPPFKQDFCGKCTRCIKACPTHCILPDRTLDARRCISYLTIENKNSIPTDLRPMIGNWIFGCDVCQIVCPWNIRFGVKDIQPELLPDSYNPYPNLAEVLGLSAPVFKQTYKDSPILRARRQGFIRNALVVSGNLANPDLIPPIANLLLNDPDLLIRLHAAWALGRMATRQSREFLTKALMLENQSLVIDEIRAALAG